MRNGYKKWNIIFSHEVIFDWGGNWGQDTYMKIYTKTGDKGKTRLVGGCLVSKSDLRIEAYGSVDELNAMLGLTIVEINSDTKLTKLKQQLLRIQNELFNLGSLLACEDSSLITKLPALTDKHVNALETEIDEMSSVLPELKNFILPGGSRGSALMHVARTICRRAERNTVKLYEKHPEVEIGMVYLNRLSDYCFVASRFCNHTANLQDWIWQK